MVTSISLTKSAQEKRERVSKLLNEVSQLYEQRDHMIAYEHPTLLSVYTELIGRLQYEVYGLETEIRKLKRRSELIQSKHNRGEQVNMQIINQTVELEFAEQEREIQKQLELMKAAKEYLNKPSLTEEESKEIKGFYRTLMKRLHPDWNPDLSEQEKELFLRAKAAYKLCDLQELRNIMLMCDKEAPIDKVEQDEMDKRIAQLEQSINDLKAKIQKLNTEFPFTYRDKLEDEEWVKAEQEKLKDKIRRLEDERRTWEAYVATQINPNIVMAEA